MIKSLFFCAHHGLQNLVGQANGKIISRNSGKFPKIQNFLEHVQDWKIPLSRFWIRKGLKAHVPWIESISKVPTTFNENLMTK